MIERKFIKEKVSDYKIQKYLEKTFKRSSYSHTIIQKTPLGEKLTIFSSKPGLIVGRGGSNIKKVVKILKEKFKMQSPQIEVQEITDPYLNPAIVAERVADALVRLGKARFKFIGHINVRRVMEAGAMGVEIKISGQVPSKRSRYWRFTQGYMPKCGYSSDYDVLIGFRVAQQKLGIIGVTVKILPPNTILPDHIEIIKELKVEEKIEEKEEEVEKKTEVKTVEKPAVKKADKTEVKTVEKPAVKKADKTEVKTVEKKKEKKAEKPAVKK